MIIYYHKNFKRKFTKLKLNERQKATDRINLFIEDPYNSTLNNHLLRGKYVEYRSINITGDLRAIYKHISENECIFITIDSHSNLYK